jgi:GTPase SAR1 family protein
LSGAEGAVLVYDVTRGHTVDACAHRYRRLLQALGQDRLPGAVVANKIDLHERAAVERGAGHALAEAFGLGYFEASAKDGDGVDAPFNHVAAELLKMGGRPEDDVAQDL